MNPGATIKFFASITRAARDGSMRPISAMRPFFTAISALNHGLPVPSTARPPEITSSNSAGADAARRQDRIVTTDSKANRRKVLFRIGFDLGKEFGITAAMAQLTQRWRSLRSDGAA